MINAMHLPPFAQNIGMLPTGFENRLGKVGAAIGSSDKRILLQDETGKPRLAYVKLKPGASMPSCGTALDTTGENSCAEAY
ncbi:hypothetical protein G6N74_02235 [Mesorhizobium sp. CGMCC 1.15528]|uniref:Uncharacterized protein n=1 Tax=Mesorhizobium zhangyense TaxID=1776730 RepID=A0A7C9R4L2_9HYPH|nr:hypothetical protein [Mesorhizobium zhangyense]NGN39874.1 hypothetical protein [Mesorhizobium zhangyense]